MNRTDVARYKALHWSLYQAQVDLDAKSACPQGHSFARGFDVEWVRVVSMKVNVNVTPKGRVVCRRCNAERAVQFRRGHKADKEGKRDGESAQ